jgi:hypothetical protein
MRTLRRAAAALATLALIALGPCALAAELGPLAVFSRLDEPLNAQIEVLSIRPGEERALAARVASQQAFRLSGLPYSPVLDDLRMTLERRRGRIFVRLATTRPVQEPYLVLLLELQAGSDLQLSQYTVRLLAPPAAREPRPPEEPGAAVQWRGFVQNTTAYDYQDPKHWSRAVLRTQLGVHGGGAGFKWRATARLDVDPVYAADDFYPAEVRRDQRRDFFIRETYFDTSLGGLNLRIGKQNIVWGEMVGLFFADVVSARDQRDFILPDFETIRIPQWALRAERFGDDTHAELVWLPVPEVDIIGKPGAEFYPFPNVAPAGVQQQFNDVVRPERGFKHSNFGMRASMLRGGWDLSAFYYRSTDVNPTFYREVVATPAPTLVFTPRHDRIWQVGGTLGKDLGPAVAKAEVIYTSGRSFNVTRLTEPDGVVPQDTVDYVLGLDFPLPRDARLNVQFFERVFSGHDPDLVFERRERGVTLLLAGKLGASLEPELLLINSLNRADRLVRPRLSWIPERNWRLTFGVDVFAGPPTGLFGRFAGNDRTYLEVRRDF